MEAVGLAIGLINVAQLYDDTAKAFLRSAAGQSTWQGILIRQFKDTEQSLRMLGDLLAQTKNISEIDLALAVRAYWSAVAQIAILKQGATARYFRSMAKSSRVSLASRQTEDSLEARYRQASCDVDLVSKNVETLRRILIIAYWDGVELAPAPEHSVLDEELMSSQVYRNTLFQERPYLNMSEAAPRTLNSDDTNDSPDDTSNSTSLGDCRLLSRGPSAVRGSIALGRLTVDEAFGLEEAMDTDNKETETDDESSLGTLSYRSTSASFSTGSNMLEGPGTAPHVYMTICMRDESGMVQHLKCLLDTGASEDCISKSCAKRLAPGYTNLIRKTRVPLVLPMANGDMIESHLKFQGTWNMLNRDQEYKHLFYLIDGLPTDVLLSRQTIFQYGFLVQNPDVLSLGLADEMSPIPGLNILGIPKTTKEQQANRAKKALTNEEERARQSKAIFERLEQLEAQHQGPPSGQNQSVSQAP